MAQSSDPDLDAVIASYDQPKSTQPQSSDPDLDAVINHLSTASKPEPEAPSHAQKAWELAKQHPLTLGVGEAENALSGVTSGIGSLADAVTLSEPGTHNWTYQPRTESGKGLQQLASEESSGVGKVYTSAFGNGPLAETVKRYGPEALGAVGTVSSLGALKGAPAAVDAQSVLDKAAASSPQSMGAAASAPRINSLTPELQSAVRDAVQKTGGAVNPEILTRHVEADSLPVPLRLTEGQASQDPVTISQEMNRRGQDPQMATHLNQQNEQLKQNVQAIRDRVGPDVFTTNDVEHGDTLINAYKAKADAAEADINSKYQALLDANGGKFPVDPKQLYDDASSALHQKLLFEHAPKELSQLEGLAHDGNMNFEQFEAMRTNLARTMRSSSNGNEVAAAGVIRQAMEDLPLGDKTAQLKALADPARSAAKAQFNAVKADPAYSAAVSGKVPPDQFVRKFVTGPSATRDGVAQMRDMIGDDETARQTMSVAALDHLRKSAGIDPMGNGNFTQAGFNKALTSLDSKLRSLVDPKTADQLGTLGNVARYTQNQPRGSFVNNSNTLVGSLAEHGKGLLEGAANTFLGGRIIPVGTMVRQAAQKRAAQAATAKSLAPGAGLTRLSPSNPVSQPGTRP